MNEQTILKRLGKQVKVRRVLLGLSQAQAAARAKVSSTTVGAIERGENNVSVSLLIKIAAALGCTDLEIVFKPEIN